MAKRAADRGPRVLLIRKTAEGTRLQQVPNDHTFSARWIARALADGLVKVQITVTPDQGEPQAYELTGFEPILDGDGQPALEADGETVRLNFTGWQATKGAGR